MDARPAKRFRHAVAAVAACLIALACFQALFFGAAYADDQGTVSVSPAEITTGTTEVTVTASGCDSLSGGTLYVGTANASVGFTSWVDTDDVKKLGNQSFTGDGSYSFSLPSGSLPAGQKFVAYVYYYNVDTDAISVSYSTPVVIAEAASEDPDPDPDPEPAAPTVEEILSGCSATLAHDGNFTADDTSAQVNVTLHDSLSQVYLTVFAYPTNSSFDPDSSANKRLWGGFVGNGDAVTCDFSANALPLAPGYSIIATLNVPIGDDNYRPVNSQAIPVVDENGQGVEPYAYPDAKIVESDLEEGATALHISLTGDERLFKYAQEGKTDISVSVGMYPADEEFDFESANFISLYNGFQVTGPIDNQEITLKEPLKAGYKVRAVAYWRQNTDILLPKGNDYEAAFKMPDDSVLVKESSVVVEPSVSLGDAYADSKTITATVAGTIPEGTALIVRAFDADASDFSNFGGGSFVASSFDVETGAVKLAPSEGSLSAGGNLVAYLVNSGSKVAQSDPVTVKAASQQGDADAISVNAETVTTDTTGVTVSVSGHSSYEGGRLIVGQGSYAKDGDSATQLGSVVFTGPGTYSFDWDAGTLKEGKHLVVYLYKYDADRDATSYAYADDIVVQAAGPAEDPDPDPEDPDPDPEEPDPVQQNDPTIQITAGKITAGMTRVPVSYTFDDDDDTTATVSVYQFDGDTLDTATALRLSQNTQVYRPRSSDTMSLGNGKLVAGQKVQAVIEVNGKTAYSNVMTVEPSPDWGTPTVRIDAKALAEGSTSIPVTVSYADEYLSMDDFYCNITVYAYPETYSDEDFEEKELNEKPDVARVVAYANNNSYGASDQTRGTFALQAVNPDRAPKQGERLIAKLRLPHTEWEGEEQDFYSASVPVAAETVPLDEGADDPADSGDGKDGSKGNVQDDKGATATDGDADESGNKDSDSGASAGKDDSGKKSTGDAAKASDSKSSKATGTSKAGKSTAKTGDDAALVVAVLAIGFVAGGVSAASARKVRRKR